MNTLNGDVAPFWDEQSNGTVRISAVQGAPGWISSAQGCSTPFGLWDDVARQIGWTEGAGKHLMLYVPRNAPGCAYGLGTVGSSIGSGGYSYVQASRLSVMGHELGHNFGLGHSSELQCDSSLESGTCRTRDYYDFYDVMGISWDQVGTLNAAQAARLGLLPSSELVALTTSSAPTTVTMSPVSAASGTRAVKLTGPDGTVYYVEYRQASGRDVWLGDGRNVYGLASGVVVRRASSGANTSLLLDATPSPSSGWDADMRQALPVGTPVTIAGSSFSVEASAAANGRVTVAIGTPAGRARSTANLQRTVGSTTVYLVVGATKYPIADAATFSALSPLGPLAFVADAQLAGLSTGATVRRLFAGPDGTPYFIDAGILLPMRSCDQVVDFGGACSTLPRLEQPMLDAFWRGPVMSSVYRTTSGKTFTVQGGTKREAVDDQALTANGFGTAGVTLLETGLAALPYGAPVLRDGVVVQDRSTGGTTVLTGGTRTAVPSTLRAATALASLPVRPLDRASVQQMTGVTVVPSAFVVDPDRAEALMITDLGLLPVPQSGPPPAAVPSVSAAFLALFGRSPAPTPDYFVKGSTSSAVYALEDFSRRKVLSWSDLVAFAGPTGPVIVTVDQRVMDVVAAGPRLLSPGSLVYAPGNASVFLVDGASRLVPVGSFAITAELGLTRLQQVTAADLAAYATATERVSTAVSCEGTVFLGLGGRAYRVAPGAGSTFGLQPTSLDDITCTALPLASAELTRFLRAPSGTIYWIVDGQKQPFASYGGYVAAGGSPSNTLQVSDFALSRFVTGPAR